MAEKKEESKAYKVVEVPTQMGLAIQDKDGKNLDQMEILAEVLNKLEEVKRAIV